MASFPNYGSDSSSLIKMYLGGEFGSDIDSVNPYAVSLCYAVDRFATWKKCLEDIYNDGGIIICDRYTTSNMIYQGAKIKDATKRSNFLNWLVDLEYNKLELPIPDKVFLLDVIPEISVNQIKNKTKDIHESDLQFQKDVYSTSHEIAKKYNWHIVQCISPDGRIHSPKLIHGAIYDNLDI